jgi:hypothetical protein
MSEQSKSQPGATWRILARQGERRIEMENQGIFDELVIDDWFHLEQMDDRRWWMRIGKASVHVVISPAGEATVTIEPDSH